MCVCGHPNENVYVCAYASMYVCMCEQYKHIKDHCPYSAERMFSGVCGAEFRGHSDAVLRVRLQCRLSYQQSYDQPLCGSCHMHLPYDDRTHHQEGLAIAIHT